MDALNGHCVHYGRCGGCQTQEIPYPEQVAAKGAALGELLAPFYGGPVEVCPSPVLWHYRNKIDPVFAPKHYDEPPPKGFVRDTVLGFKERGRWFRPLELEECRIGPQGAEALFAAAGNWHRASGLRGFDSRTGEGFLKTLLVRDAKRTGQRMVVLITTPGDFVPAPFVDMVRKSYGACSIWRGISRGSADNAFADELELLHGEPVIVEELLVRENPGNGTWDTPSEMPAADCAGDGLRLRFRVSPMSFFQTNPLGAERLYGMIREWARDAAPAQLYDLYGGMGGIAFSCADLVERVCSVENVPAASEDGRQNALDNGIANVDFVTERVKNHLKHLLQTGGMPPPSAAVVDPPRSGMHPKAIRRLVELGPPHLLYVSCNPKVLAGELPVFMEAYSIRRVRAVDLFPHTRHVEALVEMTLR